MGARFTQPKQLTNTLMAEGAMNPHELHQFLYPHPAIPDPLSCIVAYSLSGDVPKGLSVNPGTGVISGKIKHFGEQPSCTNNYPDEPLNFNGSNYLNNGRFKPETFDFNFDIKVDWLEKQDTAVGPIPCVIPGSTTKACTITVVKDYNIDNYLIELKIKEGIYQDLEDGSKLKLELGDNVKLSNVQKI